MTAANHASRRIRVLAVAQGCSPRSMSAPLVGYNFISSLARHPDLDVTLTTPIRNRASLEDDPLSKLIRIEYIDNEYIARPLYKLGQFLRGRSGTGWTTFTALTWPSYISLERIIYRRLRDELRGGSFDIIHRIIPTSPTIGSPLASYTNVPMIIGPLNGGLPWPKEYPDLARKEREWLVSIRNVYRWLPYYRSTYRHAAGVIVGSHHNASELPRWYKSHCYYMPENGINPERFPIAENWNAPSPGWPFQFVTVGRLVPYKGFDLILEAMAGSRTLRTSRLLIIGDGPFRPHLEGLIARYNLGDSVELSGHLPQTEISSAMRNSQGFVFPSLREFGGAVVLEAMACGLPTIIVDYGGPPELATRDNGILLPIAPREQLVPELRKAMESLVIDPHRCRQMSRSGIERVRSEFTWDVKAQKLSEFYRIVLSTN